MFSRSKSSQKCIIIFIFLVYFVISNVHYYIYFFTFFVIFSIILVSCLFAVYILPFGFTIIMVRPLTMNYRLYVKLLILK